MGTAMGPLAVELQKDRPLLDRSSTAERVAGILRDRIAEGLILPGTRLAEESIVEALGISRNTLREAFRLLTHERLLVHELNRGVFVRTLTEDDVAGLFRVRRLIECAAVRELDHAPATALEAIRAAVEDSERAADEGRWTDVGTANIHFHQGIVALSDSPRLEQFMSHTLAELRLIFHVMKSPRRLHEPFVARNRAILVELERGHAQTAEQLLAAYLADAERQLVRAHVRAAKR